MAEDAILGLGWRKNGGGGEREGGRVVSKRPASSPGGYVRLVATYGSSVTPDKSSQESLVEDDKHGHLIVRENHVLLNRYKIIDKLGMGTFGKVFKVEDKQRGGRLLALKMIRNVEEYRQSAEDELTALKMLTDKDPTGKIHCVKMLDFFDYHGHPCITFEMLGKSLHNFMKENDCEPFPPEQVRHIAYQLCHAVNFLHENQLTHTDLKPANVLFLNSDYEMTLDSWRSEKKNKMIRRVKNSEIRVIDFGLATFEWGDHRKLVGTRRYRSAEIILKLDWSHPCDVWSIGCIMFELLFGVPLFQARKDPEHLAMMEKILGPIPTRMKAETKSKFFSDGKLVWDEDSPAAKFVREGCFPLMEYGDRMDEEEEQMFHLMGRMLEYDVARRITLSEALKHPFFQNIPVHQRLEST